MNDTDSPDVKMEGDGERGNDRRSEMNDTANSRSPRRRRSRSRSSSRSRSRSISPDSLIRMNKSKGRIGYQAMRADTMDDAGDDEGERKSSSPDVAASAAAASASASSSSPSPALLPARPSAVEALESSIASRRHAEDRSRTLNPSLTPHRGGVYKPPHIVRAEQAKLLAESSPQNEAYQRLQWEALRKSINGCVNKVNASNIQHILPELFSENIIRGRGLFARSLLKAQMTSPVFTPIYAALLAVVNTKMPEIGELVCKRILMSLKRVFKRNDKVVCVALSRFVAHLTNQNVLHELVALQLLTLLLENPTDDSVEIAVEFVKDVGSALTTLTPQGVHGVFERFRTILNEGLIDRRVQYMIEKLFDVRRKAFKDFPPITQELDLVEAEEQITHELSMDEDYDTEMNLNVFKYDAEWEESERQYEEIKKEILGEEEEEEEEEGAEGAAPGEEAEAGVEPGMVAGQELIDSSGVHGVTSMQGGMAMTDFTEQDLVNLRRSIYLTIMSSLDYEESAHKLLKLNIKPGQEVEVCNMLIECCIVEKSYLKFYGLLSERFCRLKREYADCFNDLFAKNYALIHRFETNRLRNMAKLYAHLLVSDALDWSCLSYIRLTEEDTTSAGRIFIKVLFREMAESMGMVKLRNRMNEPVLQEVLAGVMPKDQPKNTRFAINFFTSIGLGGLTESLREHLKNAPKQIMAQTHAAMESDDDDDSSSLSDSSSSSDSSDSSDSDSDSDSSDSSSSSSSSDSDSESSDSSSSSDSEDDRRHSRSSRRNSSGRSQRSTRNNRHRSPSRSRSRSRSHRRHRHNDTSPRVKREKEADRQGEGESRRREGEIKVKAEPGMEEKNGHSTSSSSSAPATEGRKRSRRSRSRGDSRSRRRDGERGRADDRERRRSTRDRSRSRSRDRRRDKESDRDRERCHRSSKRSPSRSHSGSLTRTSRRARDSSRSISPKRRRRD